MSVLHSTRRYYRLELFGLLIILALTPALADLRQSVGNTGAVYTCPMHPDVRGKEGENCPRCGMALVPLTVPDYRPYFLDVSFIPDAIPADRTVRIRFAVRDPHTGSQVKDFAIVHERPFHLFIVSRSLEYFVHEHPQLNPDGTLDLDVRLPGAGEYQLMADFVPEGGPPQFIQRSFMTAGYTGRFGEVPALRPDIQPKAVADLQVLLTMPQAVAGREQLVTFDLKDRQTGAPVVDLEPYLGATAHLLAVSADGVTAFHSHPVAELSRPVGPTVVFQLMFPREGIYRFWAQFQRRGRVATAAFTVDVSSSQ